MASCVKPAAKTLIESSRLNSSVSMVVFKSFFRINTVFLSVEFWYKSSISYKFEENNSILENSGS